MKELNLTTTATSASTSAPASKVVVSKFPEGKITGFDASEGKLTVFFTETVDSTRKFRATAHPALRCSELLKATSTEIVIAKVEGSWKLLSPMPSKEDLDAYAQRQQAREEREATKEELAYLASF